MPIKKSRFRKGIVVTPDTDALESIEGELKVDSADNKLKTTLGASAREIVTNSQTQTLTNKGIDADSNSISNLETDNLKSGVLNTSTTLSGASDTQLPSALAVKTYVDNVAAAQNEASEIGNTPAGSISATNVQAAINELDGDIQGHITDSSDAHDASAISVSAISGLTATDVQAAIAEHQGEIEVAQADATQALADAAAAQSDITNHIADTTDAHDASAISNVPSGNLAATDVQAALNELQTDVDGRQSTITGAATTITSADLTASRALESNGSGKVAASSVTSTELSYVSGVTSSIQTQLNAKVNSSGGTLTSGSIITPSRLDVKQDTEANLYTYASTASNGQLCFATDTKKMYQVVDSTLKSVGGGVSSLDTVFQLTADEQITDWATGDNATFLGGGTISGTFVKNTSTPLHGDASYKYTQAAGSLNDYLASPAQTVDPRFRGQEVTLFFPYKYDGASNDIRVVFYDATSAAEIPSSVYLSAATTTTIFKSNIVIPSTCTSIRVGFQTAVLNSGKILEFDDVQMSSDTTVYADIANITAWQSYTPSIVGFGTTSNVQFQWRQVGENIEIQGKFTSGTSTAVEAQIPLPNSYTIDVTKLPSTSIVGYLEFDVANFSNIYTIIGTPGDTYLNVGRRTAATTPLTPVNGSAFLTSGQTTSFFASIPVVGLTASNQNIVTAPETFSTDTAPLTYADSATHTLSTLADAPVGTYITFTYAINTNTRTQTTTRPTQTDADMNTNGIQLFSRAYNAASTAGNPAAIAIQIGKGLKGVSLNLYKSTGKTTGGSLDSIVSGGAELGTLYKDYNETTGILVVDAGVRVSTSNTSHNFAFSDITSQNNGYLVINASKNPALTGIEILKHKIAYIYDSKTAGTNAGTFTSGAFRTRTLNTLNDPYDIVTSLSGNQFILPPGEYFFSCKAPAYQVARHQAKLQNITAGTTALVGTTEYLNAGASTNSSVVQGSVTISVPTTFQLQHRCENSVATNGFGQEAGSVTGLTEVYATVVITKVR